MYVLYSTYHTRKPPPPFLSSRNLDISPKQDNPLHIALFPPYTTIPGAHLEFSFHLNASLDIFQIRTRDRARVDQDLGLLQMIDERLSIWGWETGTGARFAIIVDAWGRTGDVGGGKQNKGLGEGDVKGVCSFFFFFLLLFQFILNPPSRRPLGATGHPHLKHKNL